LDLAQTLDDTRFEALALLRLGQAVADSGAASVQALDRFRQALALAETVDDRRLKAEALYEMGTIMGREEHTKGRDLIRRALELYREVGDRVGEGWALNALTLTHGAFGEYKQAQARGMESLAVLREVGDRRGEGYRRTAYGYSTMCLGAYSEALDSLREGRAICREVGETVYEARAVVAMAMLFDLVGDYARAWSRAEEALAFPEERSGLLNRAWMLAEAGLILLHRDDVEGAHDYADRALEFMDRAGDAATHGWIPHARMWAHLVRGHALLELGDADGAAQAYEAGLSVERKAGPPGMPAELRAGLARVHLIREVPAAAMKEVEEILDYLQTSHIHGTAEPPRIYFTCYQVLTAVGDTRAAPVLDEAYRFLMDRAGMIDEASLRRSYLEAVDVNRRIVSAYRSAPDLA
jgi:tetratricopeptide (TPR) repeat protein